LSVFLVWKILFYSIIWTITLLWFMIFFHSLAFFMWSSKNLTTGMFEWILWPSHYPPWIFESSFLKYIFMSILPVYFIVFWEYNLIKSFDINNFIILLLWSFFFLFLWIFTFYKWLKKYESGNIINTNI
jgi:ABC-2 type transport system permease protein